MKNTRQRILNLIEASEGEDMDTLRDEVSSELDHLETQALEARDYLDDIGGIKIQ